MIEAIEFWNEPNNLAHWDRALDPQWRSFARMIDTAAQVCIRRHPALHRVLGGICPIDPEFIDLVAGHGALDHLDRIGVHGFPIDWDCWPIDEWPARLQAVRAVTHLPIWITEVGTASMGADEIQVFGIDRSAELLEAVERVYWYSLMDLPRGWPACTAPHEATHGSNYMRHYHMGLVREDGTPKPATQRLPAHWGICQWVHWQDPRLDEMVRWMRRLGVRRLRTGISWADWHRPQATEWFDLLLERLAPFELTLTLCYTPPSIGRRPCITSPPRDLEAFAAFTDELLTRYARYARRPPPSPACRP